MKARKSLVLFIGFVGVACIAAGIGTVVWLVWSPNEQTGRLSNNVDQQVIDLMRERWAQEDTATVDGTATIKSASVTAALDEDEPYTQADLVNDVEQAFFDSNIEAMPLEQIEATTEQGSDLILETLQSQFDQLTPDQQARYAPLLKAPDDPDSFFHISNWPEVQSTPSTSARLRDFFVRPAQALLAGGFLAPTGYEYYESLDGSIQVYYPGPGVIPNDVPLTDSLPAADGDYAEDNLEYVRGQAIKVLNSLETAYPIYAEFLNAQPSETVKMYLVQDLGPGKAGLNINCQLMYIVNNLADDQLASTAAHELFHCFQIVNGIRPHAWQVIPLLNANKDWMIEGGATFAEHLAHPTLNIEHENYANYFPDTQYSLFGRSYNAGLVWHTLTEEILTAGVANQMLDYANNHDNTQQAELMKDTFHQVALDLSDLDSLYYDLGVATPPLDTADILLSPSYTEVTLTGTSAQALPLDLRKMSFDYYTVQLAERYELVRLYFGDTMTPDNQDIELSVVLEGGENKYKKLEPRTDEDGNTYYLICLDDNKVCTDLGEESLQSNANRIQVIISNRSGTEKYQGTIVASGIPKTVYKADMVVFNQTMYVPVDGELELELDVDNATMKMEADDFWMDFSEEFYDWDSKSVPESPNVSDVSIHPSRLTKYVNSFCHFRGFIEYDFGITIEEEDQGWTKRTYAVEKTDQGNFYVMDHKFACEPDPAMYDTLGITPESAIVLTFMFTRLNTTDYGEDSFAGQLHRIFKAFMTLGLKDDTAGDVELYFSTIDGSHDIMKMDLNDNLQIYFERT